MEDTFFLHNFDLASSDTQLRYFASDRAEEVRAMSEHWVGFEDDLSAELAYLSGKYGFAPAQGDTAAEAALKMSERGWWTKRLRAAQAQHHDQIARSLHWVSKTGSKYASNKASTIHRLAELRSQEYQSANELVSDKGNRLSLAEIAEHNLSNPRVRNAEMMVRIKGFEQVSALYGHTAQFFTLTTPSRFHATLSSGVPNPKYDHSTVKQAHTWLNNKWKLVRAKLHRRGIRPYGFRVAEPHHDGTPHWHLLLFSAPTHAKAIDRIIRRYLHDEAERGSDLHRVKTEVIDPQKGSAVGYIAKYISKSLDGKHIDTDLDGTPGDVAAKRITAWARTWKIRQFQQIGGPNVSVWRELRRLKPAIGQADALAGARTAADAGDWAAFVIAMGGIDRPRADHPIALHREHRETINRLTGEIQIADRAWHGGKKAPRIVGLKVGSEVVITRNEQWTTEPIGGPLWSRDSQNRAEQGALRRAAPS